MWYKRSSNKFYQNESSREKIITVLDMFGWRKSFDRNMLGCQKFIEKAI